MTDQTVETVPTEQESVQEPEVFDAAYVENLRQEAAKHRTEAKAAKAEAKKAKARVDAIIIEKETQSILADSNDLLLNDPNADIYDEAGDVDPAKVKAAAEALLERKPYLAGRKFGGDVGMGNRGPAVEPAFSFAEFLRAGSR